MSQLINYLADNDGEIKDMEIKRFCQNAVQREEQDIWNLIDNERYMWFALNEPSQRCKCDNIMEMDKGPLCHNCDTKEAYALAQSFHQTWEYPPAHKQGAATQKKWGPLGMAPLYTIGVG